MRLAGGILGRSDDMIAIRGNNFYPGALENVLRRFAEVVEYRVTIDRQASLAEMRIEMELGPTTMAAESATRIGSAIRDELMFPRRDRPGSARFAAEIRDEGERVRIT